MTLKIVIQKSSNFAKKKARKKCMIVGEKTPTKKKNATKMTNPVAAIKVSSN
jgi:hypothetical protein